MTQEALKQLNLALETMEAACKRIDELVAENKALKEALAQPEQEPVAWQLWVGADTPLNAPMGWQFYSTYDSLKSAEVSARTINSYQQAPFAKLVPLYTHPAQRTWVGLTDDEMEATFIECGGKWNGDFWKIEDADFHPFLRTIEAKLKEKNNG